MKLVRALLVALLTLATSLCLAYSLFGLGFVVCTTPQATQTIGSTFSGWDHAVFPKDDMAAIAEATRSFSIEGTSTDELFATIHDVLAKTSPDIAALIDSGSAASAVAGTGDAAKTLERYSLPDDALSHLRDCTPVFTTGRISTGVVGAFGIVGVIALALIAGRKRAGGALILGSLIVIAVIVSLGAWAALDFEGLFAWMHSLFFAQGTWTFDANSLLIRLFPEAFWAAMAGLWVISTLIFAGICAFVGRILAK